VRLPRATRSVRADADLSEFETSARRQSCLHSVGTSSIGGELRTATSRAGHRGRRRLSKDAHLRALRLLITVLVPALLAPGVLVAWSSPASAASASTIAALATANVGKQACSTNTLGGRGFETSCTGNGGQPEYWCADFAKWVWASAGVADTSWLNALAGSFYTYGQRFGTLSAEPAVGDAVVFSYDGDGDAEHVAIVTQVNPDGTVETVSGDFDGQPGIESRFASTSSVVLNAPAYLGVLGSTPDVMGMTISAFVAPVGVSVVPVVGQSVLSVGHTRMMNEAVTSPNGLYSLVMQDHTSLVEYLGARVLWSTSEVPAWFADASRRSAITLLLNDDASMAVDGPYGPIVSELPQTDILNATEALLSGQQLVSSSGFYTLTMQPDGDLVEYTAGRPLWSTGTQGHRGAWAVMKADGNLVVYSTSKVALWSSHTSGHSGGISLVLENDGDLVVDGPAGTLWANHV
jgi:hypothetical protein